MLNAIKKFFGDTDDKYLKDAYQRIEEINALEAELAALSDEDLKKKTVEFKERLAKGETVEDILPEAFATAREAAKRVLGQRHFDVQLIGGLALHEGKIAEMRTGEGKTLVATLPAYLNALSGKGVHIVTVNDYLARRDTVWMGQIYAFLGLSVGVLNSQASYLYDPAHTDKDKDELRDKEGSFRVVHEFLRPCARAEAYRANILYGTNNEYGFDYLRDNLVYGPGELVQRPGADRHHFAIIDEVDSILIDESRTPLIISAPYAESEKLYGTFAGIASRLEVETDYTVDEKMKAITLTDEGITKAEKALGVDNIYTEGGIKYVHHLETAVRAKALFHKDKNYVVKDNEVVIVDEFTGRLQPGRRWSEGLHQAIEAKEGVKIQEESRTFATITLQNYFRMYDKIAGMTGTAKTSTEEFMKVYGLDVVSIPTNKQSQRFDREDLIYQSENGKLEAIAKKIKELNEKGQPVLVGTVSIEKNELLSAHLLRAGVKHDVLNAKNHESEGSVIAAAGRKGGVVIATNMAGRGVDIKLGGINATPEEAEEVKRLGGLFVLGTERHEARRIDNQLRGRSGRQGDPGETQFFVCLEDQLMRVFASDRIKNMMGRFGVPEDEPIQNRLVSRALENAQTKIEGFNFDLRKHLLEYDDVTSHQRNTIYDRRRQILLGGAEAVEEYLKRSFEEFVFPENRTELETKINERREALGDQVFYDNAKRIILQVIDMFWVEHLEAIDYMKGSVRLRAYGQRDPLVEFKKEGLNLFKNMEASASLSALEYLSNLGNQVKEEKVALKEVRDSAEAIVGHSKNQASAPAADKVGRNDPCPCGAKKPDGTPIKYKHCHGR